MRGDDDTEVFGGVFGLQEEGLEHRVLFTISLWWWRHVVRAVESGHIFLGGDGDADAATLKVGVASVGYAVAACQFAKEVLPSNGESDKRRLVVAAEAVPSVPGASPCANRGEGEQCPNRPLYAESKGVHPPGAEEAAFREMLSAGIQESD